jgi:hypothetical protein
LEQGFNFFCLIFQAIRSAGKFKHSLAFSVLSLQVSMPFLPTLWQSTLSQARKTIKPLASVSLHALLKLEQKLSIPYLRTTTYLDIFSDIDAYKIFG